MATQDETKQCHVCGCLVFLYESGNVVPHYDPHGNKCGANYELWRERPEAPQTEAEAPARKPEGDAGQLPRLKPDVHIDHRTLERAAEDAAVAELIAVATEAAVQMQLCVDVDGITWLEEFVMRLRAAVDGVRKAGA